MRTHIRIKGGRSTQQQQAAAYAKHILTVIPEFREQKV
jgi:hypothetical protein